MESKRILKEKVDKAESKEEKKDSPKEAGIELTSDELENVDGGIAFISFPDW